MALVSSNRQHFGTTSKSSKPADTYIKLRLSDDKTQPETWFKRIGNSYKANNGMTIELKDHLCILLNETNTKIGELSCYKKTQDGSSWYYLSGSVSNGDNSFKTFGSIVGAAASSILESMYNSGYEIYKKSQIITKEALVVPGAEW